jgi:hypothetical protein
MGHKFGQWGCTPSRDFPDFGSNVYIEVHELPVTLGGE